MTQPPFTAAPSPTTEAPQDSPAHRGARPARRPAIFDEPHRRRRGLVCFLVLTFAGAWIPWFVVFSLGHSLDNPIVQLVTAAFVPAVAAVVTRRFITREGFADAGLPLQLRKSWRYYLTAALLPLGMLAIALLLAVLTGRWTPDVDQIAAQAGDYVLFVVLSPLVIVLLSPVYWGEEFGWTSYLRMRILPERPIAATLVTGLIWGAWHFPLPFVGYISGGAAPNLGVAALEALLWLPLCVVMEFILTWLWWESGTIWTSSIAHAGNNLVLSVGITAILGGQAQLSFAEATGFLIAGQVPVVIWLLVSGHARQARASSAHRRWAGRLDPATEHGG